MKDIAFLSGFISGLLTLGINLPASCLVLSDEITNTTVNKNGLVRCHQPNNAMFKNSM